MNKVCRTAYAVVSHDSRDKHNPDVIERLYGKRISADTYAKFRNEWERDLFPTVTYYVKTVDPDDTPSHPIYWTSY